MKRWKGEKAVSFSKKVYANNNYLKRFYTYKKIRKKFLKFQHSFLRMPKFIEIC